MRKLFNLKQLVIACLFVVAPLLLLHPHQEKPAPAKPIGLAKTKAPDWFAKNVTSTLYDAAGLPQKTLTATELTHFDDSQKTLMVAPLFFIYEQPAEPPWQLKAQNGVAHHGRRVDQIDEIDLSDNVLLSRAAGQHNAPMTMTTAHLRIYPDQHLAKSDDNVLFKQPGQTMAGVGMIAHLDTDTIELLHRVRGHHESQ